MNNSSISLQSPEPNEEYLTKVRELEAENIRIIEAIRAIKQSEAWSTLKTLIFDKQTNVLKRDLFSEAKKDIPDPFRLNRIAGQLKWAERFSNLDILEEDYKVQLKGIKQKLNGTKPGD